MAEDFLAVVRPGECFVFCVPDAALADRVAQNLRRTGPEWGASIRVQSNGQPAARGGRTGKPLLFLPPSQTADRTAASVKRFLRSVPAKSWILAECAAASRQHRLAAELIPLLRKKELRAVLLICRQGVPDRECGEIKDAADFYLTIEASGLEYYAQFLSARRTIDPVFFLPRQAALTESSLWIEPGPERGQDTQNPPVTEAMDISFREAFETAPEPMLLFRYREHDRVPNRRACELFGLTSEEFKSVAFADILPLEARRPVLRSLVMLKEKGRADATFTLTRRNGRHSVVHAVGARFGRDRYVAVMSDVTESRREESATKEIGETYQSIISGSALPQAILYRRQILESNDAFRRAFPWVGEGGDAPAIFGKGNAPAMKEILSVSGADSGGPLRREIRIADPESGARDFEISAISVHQAGKSLLHLTFVETTGTKRALEGLRESEQRYRALLESRAGAIALVRNGTWDYVNEGFLRLFGYSTPAELVGQPCDACVSPKDRKAFSQSVAQPKGRFEFRGVRKDGDTLILEGYAESVRIGADDLTLVYHRDISAIRAEEEETARKAKELHVLEQISDALHESLDVDHITQAGLQSSLKALGFEAGGFLDTDGPSTLRLSEQFGLPEAVAAAFAAPSTQEGLVGFVAKTLEPALLSTADYPAHLPHKALFESAKFRSIAFIPLLSRGELTGVLFGCSARAVDPATCHPATLAHLGRHFGLAVANARAHAALRAAEGLERSILNSSTDVLYKALPDGSLVFMSSQVEQLTGHTREEFLSMPDLWRSLLHPDDRPVLSERISRQTGSEERATLEYRLLPRRTAAYRWLRDSFRYVRDETGKVSSIIGTVTDITDAVERERALRESQELAGNVLESVHEGVVVYDEEFTCVSWNKALEGMTGIPREQMVGRGVLDPDREGSGSLGQLLRRALLGETVNSDEVAKALPLAEKDRTLWGRFSPLRDRSGRTIGVVGTITDVTRRKVLERDIQESEETLRNVIDAMGDALMITDLQGKVWEVNREFSLLTGYPRSEVLGLIFPYPWLMDEEMAKFVTWIAALREKRYLRDFDMTWRAKDGRTFAISLNTTLLRNAQGEPVAMLNLARNITERRQLANELAVKNKQIEILNRIISKANASIEFSKIFDSMAIEVYNLLKYDQINVGLLTDDGENQILFACVSQSVDSPDVGAVLPLARTVSKLAIDRGHAVIVGNLTAHKEVSPDVYSVAGGLKSQISIPIMLNKTILGTFNIASLQEDAFTGKELAFLQSIADQIGATIDRTQLFQRVSNDSKYIHNLLDSLDSVIYTVDRNLRIREVNKAWREFAILQQTPQFAEESAVVGQKLSDVINIPPLLDELSRVIPRLFENSIDSFSRECEVGTGLRRKIYQLVVSPMMIDGRVTALVFTNTDITESKRAEAEVRSRNKELVALNTISASISKSLKLDDVLNVASEQTAEIVGSDVVLFHLIDPMHDRLILARHRGIPQTAAEEISVLEVDNSATGAAVMEQRPLFISRGLGDDPRVAPGAREVFRGMGLQSMAIFPLRSKDKVLGSLAVVFRQAHEFTTQEQRFMTLIGNQLGSAIENAQLYAEVQSQVERVTSLYELGKGLAGALDTRRLFEVVYSEAVKSLPIDHLAYDAYVKGSGSLTRIFEVSEGNVWHGKREARAPEGQTGAEYRAATERRAVRTPSQGGASVMAVPVKSKEDVIGVLSVSKKGSQPYGDAHLRILESIANLTAIAVDRAMLFEDTLVKSTEIEQRNRELDDFTYVVSHDLKEPLITIEGYSKIVQNEYRGAVDADGQGYLSSIVQATSRMKGLIDDLLTLSRLGRVSELQQTVPVANVIADVLNDFEFTFRARHASVHVPPALPEVRYNPTQLSMVFRNLISNGLKFNTRPEPRIDIGFAEGEKEFAFSVADNGIGIEQQHFDRIFVIFQRLHRNEDYQGTGAGLTIVKKIVENHRGRIWVESEVGKGTTFHFTIPK